MNQARDDSTRDAPHCEHCAKPLHTKRLSLRHLGSDALSQLFNLERGLLFTFFELIKAPGEVCQTFVHGNRYRYMNPFRFLLVMATFTVIVTAYSATGEVFKMMNIHGTDPSSDAMVKELLNSYLNLLILVSAPFYALGSAVVFRKQGWNLAEHLVVNAYGIAMVVGLSSLVSLVGMLFPAHIQVTFDASVQVFNLYIPYLYIRCWKLPWLKGFLLGILSFLLSNFMAIATLILVLVAYKKLFG